MDAKLLGIGVAILAGGCVTVPPRGSRPAVVAPAACPDGAPVRWLQDPSCGRVCGYSCLPDRWTADPKKGEQ